jgi:hypothetical protein
MMLEDLYAQVASSFPATTQKDLKTAVKVLAQAFAYPHPRACPLEVCRQPLPELYRKIEAHLRAQGKGPHTLRNTKNNLSRMFRLAAAHGLMTLPPRTPVPTFAPREKRSRPGGACTRPDGTYLRFAHWPPTLQADFTAFATWATAPLVEGREARWQKRPSTVENYQRLFAAYFGFLSHVRHMASLEFEQLFDFSLIHAFVHWHVNERHGRVTVFAHEFLKSLLALTRQYRPQPALHAQLLALRRTMPRPHPTFQKSDAWVSLAELDQIGAALWPQKLPTELQGSGRFFAHRASLSLVLRLWVYIPYRQRNMREMRLHENLYQDTHGLWRIRFAREQLKIAMKQGRPNIFDLPFPPALVPTLETYLQSWHPRLVAGTASAAPLLFPTTRGTPYNATHFNQATQEVVYAYTGQYWHPHIVRSVWATEWIRTTRGDFYTAAVMLNDKLDTVIKNYAHLLDEDVAEKAYSWVDTQVGKALPRLGSPGGAGRDVTP